MTKTHKKNKYNYWLGGLNPGLLWIWSSSARPVNPFVNLTSFEKMDGDQMKTNETTTPTTTATEKGSNAVEIKGNGRCLNLSFNSTSFSFEYYGQDCNIKQAYICELQAQTNISNEITKMMKAVK